MYHQNKPSSDANFQNDFQGKAYLYTFISLRKKFNRGKPTYVKSKEIQMIRESRISSKNTKYLKSTLSKLTHLCIKRTLIYLYV